MKINQPHSQWNTDNLPEIDPTYPGSLQSSKRNPLATFFRFSLVFSICILLFVACQTPQDFKAEPGDCSVPAEMKTELKEKGRILGCWVVYWKNPPTYDSKALPVILQKDGSIQARTAEDDGTGNLSLQVPSDKQKPLLFRLYFFKGNKEFSQHERDCITISDHKYDCFSGKKDTECWTTARVVPKHDSAFKAELSNNKSCQFCTPEVCDGKDNNCNGQVDENDALKDLPCTGTPDASTTDP